MFDYRKAIADADAAINNGYSLSDEEREVALNAINGYFNHVRMYRLNAYRTAIHTMHNFDDKYGHDFEESVFNWVNNHVSEMNDVVDYFPVLVHLGYRPSKDFAKVREAEEFGIDYRITAEKDDELPCTPDIFYLFEKSAFLPCEIIKYKRKLSEIVATINK